MLPKAHSIGASLHSTMERLNFLRMRSASILVAFPNLTAQMGNLGLGHGSGFAPVLHASHGIHPHVVMLCTTRECGQNIPFI